MSHHHVLHLDVDVAPQLVGDAVGRLVGLADGPSPLPGVTLVRRWVDDPGWVTVVAAAPPGAQLRDRSAEASFDYLHLTSPWDDDPDEPPSGRPLVRTWGRDPFGLAVLTTLGTVFGGHLIVNDDWRPDVRERVPVELGQVPLPARIRRLAPVSRQQVADAAHRIQALDGPTPHRVHVPALARRRVPAYAA